MDCCTTWDCKKKKTIKEFKHTILLLMGLINSILSDCISQQTPSIHLFAYSHTSTAMGRKGYLHSLTITCFWKFATSVSDVLLTSKTSGNATPPASWSPAGTVTMDRQLNDILQPFWHILSPEPCSQQIVQLHSILTQKETTSTGHHLLLVDLLT